MTQVILPPVRLASVTQLLTTCGILQRCEIGDTVPAWWWRCFGSQAVPTRRQSRRANLYRPPHRERRCRSLLAGSRRSCSAAEDTKDGPCIQTTHGCIALNPDVDEDTIDGTICESGYTKSVRPATSYTNGVKKKLMREAGIDAARIGDYELDHIEPLELGGHPRKLSNLMLQPWEGQHGAWAKDTLEGRLRSLVCHGKLDLTDAQVCIAQDWEACALQYPRR